MSEILVTTIRHESATTDTLTLGADGSLTINGTASLNGSAVVTEATMPAGGVTSLNGETGAITNNTYGAIGSYFASFGGGDGGGVVLVGDTVSGSVLNIYKTGGVGYSNAGLSGTWRQMGSCEASSNVPRAWVRIS